MRQKSTGVYDYLQSSGILLTGTGEDIELAKKQYWHQKRREYKRNRYRKQKSFAIFLTNSEIQLIKKVSKNECDVTNFIKQAAMSAVNNKTANDRKFIGQIRKCLQLHYFSIQSICEERALDKEGRRQVLNMIASLEEQLLSLIQY